MAEHHLPPEPDHQKKGVHAGDLKPGSRGRWYGYGRGRADDGDGGLRGVCFAVLVILLVVGIVWLVLYVVYRPSDPTLTVLSASVLGIYNATSSTNAGPTTTPGAGAVVSGPAPTLVAASFQFTLVIRNPSARSAARYDRLTAYAAYRGEALTPPALLPPLAQDADTAVAVAPVLGGGGEAVPVSPGAAAALAADVAYGAVPVRVVLLGRVRFLSGPFRGRWHSLYGRCDVVVGVVRGTRSPDGEGAPLLGNPVCSADT